MFHLNDRLLEKLIDGSASGSEVNRIRNHTESCRACARRLEEWRDNYRELDQHFPELATESGPAATVTPGGLVLLPSVEEPKRRWELELTTLLWIATVLMALLVGYGASRLRQPNEGMAVANRGITPTPTPTPAPPPAANPQPQPPASGLAAGGAPVVTPEARKTTAATAPNRAPATTPATSGAARPRGNPPAPAPEPEPKPLPVSPRFRALGAREASLRLGGRLRLVSGLEPDHFEVGPATAVPGAQAGLDVVRVVYRTVDGGRILVDQQLIPADSSGFRPIDDPALESGETAYGTSPTGVSVATWLDEEGYRISVVAQAPVDSLKRLVQRVQ